MAMVGNDPYHGVIWAPDGSRCRVELQRLDIDRPTYYDSDGWLHTAPTPIYWQMDVSVILIPVCGWEWEWGRQYFYDWQNQDDPRRWLDVRNRQNSYRGFVGIGGVDSFGTIQLYGEGPLYMDRHDPQAPDYYQWATAVDLARSLGIKVTTLYNRAAAGKWERRKHGRKVYYLISDALRPK